MTIGSTPPGSGVGPADSPLPDASPLPTFHGIRRGLAWTAFGRISVQLVQLGTSIVVTRLLAPSDFGIALIAMAVIGFANLFVELGISSAVVQHQRPDQRYLVSAFWLNALVGIAVAALVWVLTPLLAHMFHSDRLNALLPVAGLSLVLSLGVVHAGLLRRRLAFGRISVIELTTALATGTTSIVLATLGAGPWALVVGSLAGTVVTTLLYWRAVRWAPSGKPSRVAIADLWRFNRGLLGYNSLNYWSRNADNVLIGRYLGVSALGYYGRAYNAMLLPISQVSTTITAVLFPSLSRLQGDRRRMGDAWAFSAKASWLIGAPIGLGACVTAPALVETLFGERWLPVAPLLALLALSTPAQLVGQNTGAIFQATGRTGQLFRLGLLSTVLTIAAIVVALPHGVLAVAGAVAAKSWVTVWVVLLPALRLADVPLGAFAKSLGFSGIASLASAAAAWGAGRLVDALSAPVVLMVQIASGAAVYGVLILVGERPFLRRARGGRK